MSMTFTLTCHCGAEIETNGATFADVTDQAAALGWNTTEPTCPDHTAADQSGSVSRAQGAEGDSLGGGA